MFISTLVSGISSLIRRFGGAYFSGIGCAVIIGINVIFVPKYGYIACAWAGFLGNATAMVLSYIVGQRKYPIDYPLKSIGVYVLIGGLFFAIISYTNANLSVAAALGINTFGYYPIHCSCLIP